MRLFHVWRGRSWQEIRAPYCPLPTRTEPGPDYTGRALAFHGGAPRCRNCGAALVRA